MLLIEHRRAVHMWRQHATCVLTASHTNPRVSASSSPGTLVWHQLVSKNRNRNGLPSYVNHRVFPRLTNWSRHHCAPEKYELAAARTHNRVSGCAPASANWTLWLTKEESYVRAGCGTAPFRFMGPWR